MTQSSTFTLGLLQSSSRGTREKNLEVAVRQIRDAAERGANVIITQELFVSDYFCVRQDEEAFEFAEPIPGPTSDALCALAQELGVVIVGSLFEKRMAGIYHNTAVIIDADGSLLGTYRKMHIPQDPAFEEKFYFTPGDQGFRCWETRFAKIGVLICWDQWFPEAARLTAMQGAEVLVYPTAIGGLASESPENIRRQHMAWEAVQRGHGVANGSYVAAVNRHGVEAPIAFWGQSFISDFSGEILQRAPVDKDDILIQTCDRKALESHRRTWPFFRDRRVDAYTPITQLSND
ncbi:MAG: carbon-nitrogen hydrolase [Opitutales bacterium]